MICESSQNLWAYPQIDVGTAECFLMKMYWLCSQTSTSFECTLFGIRTCMEVYMASTGIYIMVSSIITITLQMQFEWWLSCKFTLPCSLAGVQSGKSPFHSPLASSFQCLTVLAIVCAAVAFGFAVYRYLPWAQILIETQDTYWKGMLWTTGMLLC